ncbi:unnamed protein product [Bursaphelenchus okinawaensis]|uniref:DNA2/NAM7 helicase-like C-terminal domain-containing protein n=1 Tax=Bursaphelenchus okinawaensis TaxID=465554 RepID=A0A811LT07_9BILA|nr:unnamed protein product [Bursaphelenchus okinawaensis]CAG9127593.1 unnamed protein product [Bursaphelenchus okinawaensis]
MEVREKFFIQFMVFREKFDLLEKYRFLLDEEEIDASTINKSFGSEREVIIMTTARTQKLGFLACDLRLNTAITRAQRLLIIVGNRNNLDRDDTRRKFINYIVKNKAMYDRIPDEPSVLEFADSEPGDIDKAWADKVAQCEITSEKKKTRKRRYKQKKARRLKSFKC